MRVIRVLLEIGFVRPAPDLLGVTPPAIQPCRQSKVRLMIMAKSCGQYKAHGAIVLLIARDPDPALAPVFVLALARPWRSCLAVAGLELQVPAACEGLSLAAAAACDPELADVLFAVAERAGRLGHPAGVA